MVKLEEKLIELGYINHIYYWSKNMWVNNQTFVVVQISKDLTGTIGNCVIKSQQDIDNLQQAFNQLQLDLKELKECIYTN